MLALKTLFSSLQQFQLDPVKIKHETLQPGHSRVGSTLRSPAGAPESDMLAKIWHVARHVAYVFTRQ